MSDDVSQILSAIEMGDPHAPGQLLPLVYDELRRLAAQKLAQEKAGQTLQPTALVHEAYLRLVGPEQESEATAPKWEGHRHFFAAAAQAMRHILVDRARRKKRNKHGGGRQQVDLEEHDEPIESSPAELIALEEQILALDAALPRLAEHDPEAAKVVELHFFAGLSVEQCADALAISRATAYRQWRYARAWLRRAMDENPGAA